MIHNRYSKDLKISPDQDIFLDNLKKDLKVISNEEGAVLRQVARMRIASSSGDWALLPEIGCNLKDLQGHPNDARLGATIKSYITGELMREQMLRGVDLDITVFPTNKYSLGIFIVINTDYIDKPVVMAIPYSTHGYHSQPKVFRSDSR